MMFWNKILGRAAIAAVCAALTLWAAPAFAGGFFIVGEAPTGKGDEKDALLIVSVVGCHQLGQIHAKAEGLVNGRRRTLALTLTALTGNRFAVYRQCARSWGREGVKDFEKGVWGISVYAVSAKPVTAGGKTFLVRDAAFFPCGADRRPKLRPVPADAQPDALRMADSQRLTPLPAEKAEEIDAALRAASELTAVPAVAAN